MMNKKERVFDIKEIEVDGFKYLVLRSGNVIGKVRMNDNLKVIGEIEFLFTGEMEDIEGYKWDGEQQKGIEFNMVEIMTDMEMIRKKMDELRPVHKWDFE